MTFFVENEQMARSLNVRSAQKRQKKWSISVSFFGQYPETNVKPKCFCFRILTFPPPPMIICDPPPPMIICDISDNTHLDWCNENHRDKTSEVKLLEVKINVFEDNPLSIELPISIKCKVISTDATLKGQTVPSSYKPATLENGINIMVPPFINTGDKIVLDTRTLEYIKKVK